MTFILHIIAGNVIVFIKPQLSFGFLQGLSVYAMRNKKFKISVKQALVLPGYVADLKIKITDYNYILQISTGCQPMIPLSSQA